jgi:hypothetical protein
VFLLPEFRALEEVDKEVVDGSQVAVFASVPVTDPTGKPDSCVCVCGRERERESEEGREKASETEGKKKREREREREREMRDSVSRFDAQ